MFAFSLLASHVRSGLPSLLGWRPSLVGWRPSTGNKKLLGKLFLNPLLSSLWKLHLGVSVRRLRDESCPPVRERERERERQRESASFIIDCFFSMFFALS